MNNDETIRPPLKVQQNNDTSANDNDTTKQ